jgi:hypothetical protein
MPDNDHVFGVDPKFSGIGAKVGNGCYYIFERPGETERSFAPPRASIMERKNIPTCASGGLRKV